MPSMPLRSCGIAMFAVVILPVCSGEELVRGDICYRFCENMSQNFLNKRDKCPADAPCKSPLPPDQVSFDQCGSNAHTCGGVPPASASFAQAHSNRKTLDAGRPGRLRVRYA